MQDLREILGRAGQLTPTEKEHAEGALRDLSEAAEPLGSVSPSVEGLLSGTADASGWNLKWEEAQPSGSRSPKASSPAREKRLTPNWPEGKLSETGAYAAASIRPCLPDGAQSRVGVTPTGVRWRRHSNSLDAFRRSLAARLPGDSLE